MIFAWIKAYFLRMIKRPAIIGIIAATVIISVVLSGLSKGAMSGFACGILKSDDENITAVISELKNENSILNITVYEDEEEMLKAQRRGELRFAYVFDDEFTEKYENNETRRTVTRFSGEDDIFAALADELVFAKIASVYARTSIEYFARTNSNIGDEYREEVKKTALLMYDEYLDILGDVFIYETENGNVVSDEGGSASFPVRGVLAMLVLIAALLGMQTVLNDSEKSLFLRLSPKNRNIAMLIGILMPTLLLAATLVVCVLFSAVSVGIFREIICALLLVCSCAAFVFFISSFLKNPDSAAIIIPLAVLLSIALCPIFFDITVFLKPMRHICALLPPYYYLYAISKSAVGMAGSVIMAVIYLLAGLLIRKIKNT